MLASRLSRQLLSRVSARRLSGEAMQLKVGIVGAGAVGTYFGVRLAELGHDVRFLLNPGEAPPKALTVNSWQGDFELDAPTYASSPGELAGGGEALDWVLVGLKSTALDGDGAGQMARLVGPAVGDGTRVQLLMNGLGAEELAADARALRKSTAASHGGFGRPAPDAVLHEGMATELRGGSFVDDPAEIAAASGSGASGRRRCRRIATRPSRACASPSGPSSPGTSPSTARRSARTRTSGRSGGATAARRAIGLMREVIRARTRIWRAGAEPRLDEEATVDALCAITDKMAEQDYVPRRPATSSETAWRSPSSGRRRATKLGVDAPRLHMLAALHIINEKQ
ncbi:PanE/ApbA-like ketopantoate reductase [Aureococcus anophagefferens]|nr:PanE/ApbA-like ketopantoate reductase [Aureococcus anophagefferens]